jgi:hypothetical protein
LMQCLTDQWSSIVGSRAVCFRDGGHPERTPRYPQKWINMAVPTSIISIKPCWHMGWHPIDISYIMIYQH